jgi:hypothetical protein
VRNDFLWECVLILILEAVEKHQINRILCGFLIGGTKKGHKNRALQRNSG